MEPVPWFGISLTLQVVPWQGWGFDDPSTPSNIQAYIQHFHFLPQHRWKHLHVFVPYGSVTSTLNNFNR